MNDDEGSALTRLSASVYNSRLWQGDDEPFCITLLFSEEAK